MAVTKSGLIIPDHAAFEKEYQVSLSPDLFTQLFFRQDSFVCYQVKVGMPSDAQVVNMAKEPLSGSLVLTFKTRDKAYILAHTESEVVMAFDGPSDKKAVKLVVRAFERAAARRG